MFKSVYVDSKEYVYIDIAIFNNLQVSQRPRYKLFRLPYTKKLFPVDFLKKSSIISLEKTSFKKILKKSQWLTDINNL